MTIPLIHEDDIDPELKKYGMENCCFCYEETPYWNKRKDVAVCPGCSKQHKVSEIPKKEPWAKAVQIALDGGGYTAPVMGVYPKKSVY